MSGTSSLRLRLVVGIMVPALILIALDGISVYGTALDAANEAYDRTLLASAKFIGAVLNRVNITKHSYYYSPYYRKEYGKYYQRSPHQA